MPRIPLACAVAGGVGSLPEGAKVPGAAARAPLPDVSCSPSFVPLLPLPKGLTARMAPPPAPRLSHTAVTGARHPAAGRRVGRVDALPAVRACGASGGDRCDRGVQRALAAVQMRRGLVDKRERRSRWQLSGTTVTGVPTRHHCNWRPRIRAWTASAAAAYRAAAVLSLGVSLGAPDCSPFFFVAVAVECHTTVGWV